MILTDRFVYVHQPKTGGSFVTSALYRIHEQGVRRPGLRRLVNRTRLDKTLDGKYGRFVDNRYKHGPCRAIPAKYADKPILATVRNPFDRYVSEYEFGWWKRRKLYEYFSDAPGFTTRYANFPELTFEEYVRLVNDIPRGYFCSPWASDAGIGRQTREFLQYYARKPPIVFEYLVLHDGDARTMPEGSMYDVHFLRTDSLNAGLHAFLLGAGYDPEDIAFVEEMARVLPGGKGRTSEQAWQKYYPPALREKVRRKESALLRMFPEFDPGPA